MSETRVSTNTSLHVHGEIAVEAWRGPTNDCTHIRVGAPNRAPALTVFIDDADLNAACEAFDKLASDLRTIRDQQRADKITFGVGQSHQWAQRTAEVAACATP